MKKIKIAVLISGGGTNLQALLDAQKSGVIKSGEITLVISNKAGVYGLERAKTAGVKSLVITKKECGGTDEFNDKLLEVLKEHGIEMVVLAGFLAILSKKFTDTFKDRIINVHPSLIPSFCGVGYYGLKVHEEALKYGVKVTGATVHYVNEIADGGQSIMQKAVEILDGDTPEILQKRVMEQAEWIILPNSTELLAKKLINEK